VIKIEKKNIVLTYEEFEMIKKGLELISSAGDALKAFSHAEKAVELRINICKQWEKDIFNDKDCSKCFNFIHKLKHKIRFGNNEADIICYCHIIGEFDGTKSKQIAKECKEYVPSE